MAKWYRYTRKSNGTHKLLNILLKASFRVINEHFNQTLSNWKHFICTFYMSMEKYFLLLLQYLFLCTYVHTSNSTCRGRWQGNHDSVSCMSSVISENFREFCHRLFTRYFYCDILWHQWMAYLYSIRWIFENAQSMLKDYIQKIESACKMPFSDVSKFVV